MSVPETAAEMMPGGQERQASSSGTSEIRTPSKRPRAKNLSYWVKLPRIDSSPQQDEFSDSDISQQKSPKYGENDSSRSEETPQNEGPPPRGDASGDEISPPWSDTSEDEDSTALSDESGGKESSELHDSPGYEEPLQHDDTSLYCGTWLKRVLLPLCEVYLERSEKTLRWRDLLRDKQKRIRVLIDLSWREGSQCKDFSQLRELSRKNSRKRKDLRWHEDSRRRDESRRREVTSHRAFLRIYRSIRGDLSERLGRVRLGPSDLSCTYHLY